MIYPSYSFKVIEFQVNQIAWNDYDCEELELNGLKFSGLILNSGFWGWLSIESQPQNAELGRFNSISD